MTTTSPAVGDDRRARLVVLTDLLGPVFGTENICFFLYSLIRMQRPQCVVELGAGLGVSSLWMAEGARQNRCGHVWTLDDFGVWAADGSLLGTVCAGLTRAGYGPIQAATPDEYFDRLATGIGVEDVLSVIHTHMDLTDVHLR